MFWPSEDLDGLKRGDAIQPHDIVCTRGAAKILGLSESGLCKMRAFRPEDSPPFLRCGRKVFYRIGDLQAWQDARLARHNGNECPPDLNRNLPPSRRGSS